MTGLFLLAVVGVWLVASIAITRWIARRFDSPIWRKAIAVVIFPTLLVTPVADELIGMRQLHALCQQYAVQKISEQHAMNRRVVFERRASDVFAEGTAVSIRIDPKVYRDSETNEVLISYFTLHAEGGWFIRALGISETKAPLLFNSGCAPEGQDDFKKKFNITVIN